MSIGHEDRLIVAANRLPVVVRQREDGGVEVEPASGGLVAAMQPVLTRHSGAWIGWPGIVDVSGEVLEEALGRFDGEHEIVPVELSAEERDAFYQGFSNEIIWPLFHDLQTNCNFDPAYWEAYVQVNRRYASAIARLAKPGDVIWVHDYHLILVGAELRRLGVDNRVGFFFHIPFPGVDIFRKLPWREPVVDALLAYDLVGLQTAGDRQNFVRSMQSVRPLELASRDEEAHVASYRVRGTLRTTRVGDFPIGVDFAAEERDAESPEALAAMEMFARDMPKRRLVLGVDRLDYTKGILERLLAFREALRRHPELRGTTTLVQVVVPSREDIPSYHALRESIERLVGEIVGELSRPGWVPVLYMHKAISRGELRGFYRAAQVALVTPLKDGMNLVAKEYCASRVDEQGVLVLSEFAGAGAQLGEGALLVNPNDRIACADTIARACNMAPEEQRRRMRAMREVVRRDDVYAWADAFLGQLQRVPERRATRRAAVGA